MRRWLCLPPRPRKMHHFKKVYHRGRSHVSAHAQNSIVSVAVDKGDFAALASRVGAAPSREGVLLKYTNVVKGWKRRRFTLENGVLTYESASDDGSAHSSGARPSDRADDAGDDFSRAQASRTQSGTKRTRPRLRAKRRLLRRHQSRDEKERDIKGRINLQFAVISADETDRCRFAIDVGFDVYHCKAESEAECASWVDILTESNEYFKGLIKNAALRAKERPLSGREWPSSPQRESRSDESDESVLEDDGLREAEESRKALMGELRHVVEFWRGKWLDGNGGVAVSEHEFLSTLAGAFASGPDPGRRGRKGASVPGTAKQLLDLTAWSLQVLTTNDEMYDRRLKADLARMMGRAVPVFPQPQVSQTEYEQDRIYREGELSEGESELEFFDALSRSASVHSQSRLQSPVAPAQMAVPDVPAPGAVEAEKSGSLNALPLERVETSRLEQTNGASARTRLPAVEGGRAQPNIWGIVKDAVGQDLSKISIPVVLNEPISFVQRLAEDIEYCELFDKAANNSDPFERLMYVAAGVVSHYSSTLGRVGKPFNPLLGETYEMVLPTKGDGMRFVAEQVSHHPPISACYGEGSGGKWKYYNAIEIKNKFWGKSMEIFPTGLNHLEIPEYGDHYVFEQVTACVHNIVVGRIWLDNYGEMEIIDRKTRNKCVLTFNKTGWMSDSRTFASVKGVVQDASGKTRIKLAGHWNERLYRDGGRGKQETIWTAAERPPVSASNGYNWTKWAITLNQPVEDGMRARIAPTDSRFRPDQRALENGDLDMASDRKLLLEQGQRARRRALEESGGEYAPRWFRKIVDEETGRDYFRFTGDYFRCKSEQDWGRCDDLFSCALPAAEANGADAGANGVAGEEAARA